jgi:tRNA pseudouridine55 synthase
MFDGILIIDKPEGITSHDVVARCRRILRTKRIGHTGTLDPFATGVMVILVGRATRLAQFLDKDAKEYEAIVRFGFETGTGDRTGAPKDSAITDFRFQISDQEIEEALKNFRGAIMQTPPMYSAKKVEGKKLYELARKGIEIERQPVKITIYELETLSEPPAVAGGLNSRIENQETENRKPKTEDRAFRVLCSAGTYIRVLAEDIGRKLKTGAHLAELRRTKAGKFAIEKSVTLEKLEEIVAENRLADVLISTNEAVSHLAEIKLTAEEARKIQNGMKLKYEAEDLKDGEFLRLTTDENLLAIGFYRAPEKVVQPKLVLV